jgi:hypothetical protein
LPVLLVARLLRQRTDSAGGRTIARLVPLGIALLLLASVAWRDLPDYYITWPERGLTRFLYRAGIRDLAGYLNENPGLSDIAVGGFLAGPWDRLALTTDLQDPAATRARWFNPERAIMLETGNQPAMVFRSKQPEPAIDEAHHQKVPGEAVAEYQLFKVNDELLMTPDQYVCFQNGLCVLQAAYDAGSGSFYVTWEVHRPLDLPERPLISNPPPVGVYAGPRLLVFAQLLDANGQMLVGDDGFWVDESTLYPGDRFRQVHYIPQPSGATGAVIVFGLYDPMTGTRIMTQDGRDHIEYQLPS